MRYRLELRRLMRPFIIMTGIFLRAAMRRKFGQISVSTRTMARGLTMVKMRSVKYGRSSGKYKIPSAPLMI